MTALIPAQTLSGTALLGPVLLAALSLVPALRCGGREALLRVARIAQGLLALAVFAAVAVAAGGPLQVRLLEAGAWSQGLYLDALSCSLWILVAFLGVIVSRYAANSLDGDPGQARFARHLCLALVSVLLLLLADNLLLLTAAWVSTSLNLHPLLRFYRDRPQARRAAWKKFVISRCGDACLIGAVVLLGRSLETWNFRELFLAAEALQGGGAPANGALAWACGLLVAGAMMKSAQFPFHSWLPETLEAPTAVSALMHAGILHAGGYLVLRLSPLLVLHPGALQALAWGGAVTAVCASLVLLTQTSVKGTLAWSTVAQMGFMMLQCGLGAFALAVLHLIAHSLYKSHAFLASGSVSRHGCAPVRPAVSSRCMLGVLGLVFGLKLAGAAMLGGGALVDPGRLLLASVFAMSLAHLLWTFWSSGPRAAEWLTGVSVAAAATLGAGALQFLAEGVLADALPRYVPAHGWASCLAMAGLAGSFLFLLIAQSRWAVWSRYPLLQRLYVHAGNGFYLGTLAHRLLSRPH